MDASEKKSQPPRSIAISPEGVPDHVIIEKTDGYSTDSSAGKTSLTLGSPARLRSRNNMARKRRESREESLPLTESAGSPERKKRVSGKPSKRRIVIGGRSLLHRLRVLSAHAQSAFKLFLKLRFKYKICVVLLSICVYIRCYKTIRRARDRYIGRHPIHGGYWGEKLDRINVRRIMKQTRQRKAQELVDLGVELPATEPPGSLLEIDTNAALREHLIRREARARHLNHAEAVADTYQRNSNNTIWPAGACWTFFDVFPEFP